MNNIGNLCTARYRMLDGQQSRKCLYVLIFKSPVQALLQHTSVDLIHSPCLHGAPLAVGLPAWLCWFRLSAFARGSPSPLQLCGAPPGQFAACERQQQGILNQSQHSATSSIISSKVGAGPCDFQVCALFEHDRKQWLTCRGQWATVSCWNSQTEEQRVENKHSCQSAASDQYSQHFCSARNTCVAYF